MSSTQQLLLGEGAGGSAPVYIEDVFNIHLYTGNDLTQIVTNGIDLATKGGLVWNKGRDSGTTNHILVDTAQGTSSGLITNTTDAAGSSNGFTSFDTTGFTFGGGAGSRNNGGTLYCSWTFRKQPKFFDIVTYTGDGIIGRTVAHNLGSVPGCIIVKRTSLTGTNWRVYHRSLGATYSLQMNTTAAAQLGNTIWDDTEPTSAVFSVGDNGGVNSSGDSFVAYLFAHDAGGFGLAGTDNVISCGSFTTDGSGNFSVNLGYEPQWVMIKSTDNTGVSAAQQNWIIMDSMRGFLTQSGNGARLRANTAEAESSTNDFGPTATGFESLGNMSASAPFIYIAIRRGPMKVPTVGTTVFGLSARSGTGADATVTGSAGVSDAVLIKNRGSAVASLFAARLTATNYLVTSSDAAQVAAGVTILQANPWDVMDGVKVGTTSTITNASGNTYINYLFDRAPSFMDVVCYTGTEVARTINHNLGVAPELLIVKRRDGSAQWRVYNAVSGTGFFMNFNGPEPVSSSGISGYWNNTTPTSSVFSLGDTSSVNGGGYTFVAYLFATCAGVSKVGSYTGNAGNTVTVPCGFTAGVRFVLIKRTDDTADWYVWDTARGIIAGNDPYWLTSSAAAEVTGTDYVDTYSAGFEVTSTAPAALNATGGTYIFLAIA